MLEHHSLCHLPTHSLPCQLPGSHLSPWQTWWTDRSMGLLVSSPSGGLGHQGKAGGEEELLWPITVTAGRAMRTVTVRPGATCFKNQPHKRAKNQWKGHQMEVCGYSFLPCHPFFTPPFSAIHKSMVGGSLRPYHSNWL